MPDADLWQDVERTRRALIHALCLYAQQQYRRDAAWLLDELLSATCETIDAAVSSWLRQRGYPDA